MKGTADRYGYIPGGAMCPDCGKAQWPTKADAKRAAKRFHPGARLNVYRCGEAFHLGHLPDAVRHGVVGRDAILNTRRPS